MEIDEDTLKNLKNSKEQVEAARKALSEADEAYRLLDKEMEVVRLRMSSSEKNIASLTRQVHDAEALDFSLRGSVGEVFCRSPYSWYKLSHGKWFRCEMGRGRRPPHWVQLTCEPHGVKVECQYEDILASVGPVLSAEEETAKEQKARQVEYFKYREDYARIKDGIVADLGSRGCYSVEMEWLPRKHVPEEHIRQTWTPLTQEEFFRELGLLD